MEEKLANVIVYKISLSPLFIGTQSVKSLERTQRVLELVNTIHKQKRQLRKMK